MQIHSVHQSLISWPLSALLEGGLSVVKEKNACSVLIVREIKLTVIFNTFVFD